MPKDKGEDESENVFKLTILVPLIQYLEVFIDHRHNLAPDEFLEAIFTPQKPKSPLRVKIDYQSSSCVTNLPGILSPNLQAPPISLQRPIAELFFEINRLLPFMMNLVDEFRNRRNRRDLDDASQTIVIVYILIYRTSVSSINDAIDCLVYFSTPKMLALLSFLLTPKLASWIYITGCDTFDLDFVEQKIMSPFTNALAVLQTIHATLLATTKQKTTPKKVTIPVQMNVLKHPKRFPAPPVCTPEKVSKVPVQPVPETLYKQPDIESRIAKLREEHRLQATQRLKDANAGAPACFKVEKSERYRRVLDEIADARTKLQRPVVVKRIQTFGSVPVKKTVTTILREGARIAKAEVKEVEKLKELMKGSFDPADIQRIEDEMRELEREENLRKIEENHLSGLISYEESILAKQQLIDEAKEQGDRVRTEREELNRKLDKYRLEETEKLKRIVEKCHEAEQAAKNSYASMVGEKRQKAAEVAEESRRIKLHLVEKNEEELRRKLQIIREIKTLQTLQGVRSKEFDPNETSGLGLMCEMSLAELKNRLIIAKGKWHDELLARREIVKGRRQKQKELLDCVQKTICEYRASRQSIPSSTTVTRDRSKALQTPELLALRKKLDERRMTRFEKTNTASMNVLYKSKLFTKS